MKVYCGSAHFRATEIRTSDKVHGVGNAALEWIGIGYPRNKEVVINGVKAEMVSPVAVARPNISPQEPLLDSFSYLKSPQRCHTSLPTKHSLSCATQRHGTMQYTLNCDITDEFKYSPIVKSSPAYFTPRTTAIGKLP